MNDEIKDLKKELELAKKELKDFIYIVSHDIKTPIRNVKAFNIKLKKNANNLPKKERKYLDFISNSMNEIEVLLDALTEYSIVISSEEINREINMNDLIRFVLIELNELIKNSNAKIVIKSDLPIMIGKEKLIHKLFKHLISNAIIFNDTIPEITIDYKYENERNIFSIKDNGIGISKKSFDKIFKIFYRLKEKESVKSAGVGLAVCKRIIDIHKGEIWLESIESKESIFYISF